VTVAPRRPAVDPRIAAGADYGASDGEWRRVEWGRRRHSIELGGGRVDYVELGEGEPLLFVHGLSGCWRNWLENLPHFGTGYRAIALDLPGFGTSPMPSWPISMEAYGKLLHELCEALGLDRPTLVGNSMGGLIAAEAALGRPELYRKLALVSAAGIINTWQPQARATATAWGWKRFGTTVADRGARFLSRPRTREALLGPFIRYPNQLPVDLLWEQIDGGVRCPGFGDALRALVGYDARERLGSIELPTLIVSGLTDRIVPVSAAISYHRRIPRSRLEIFERTGHVPQLERPLRFNAALDEFLVTA
jgi:pimeloyl-ACP methyl ester carboxylesterase